MLEASHNKELPVIPGKHYFTIGEVSELCEVKYMCYVIVREKFTHNNGFLMVNG